MIIEFEKVYVNNLGYRDAIWICPICGAVISQGLINLPRRVSCYCKKYTNLFYTLHYDGAHYNITKSGVLFLNYFNYHKIRSKMTQQVFLILLGSYHFSFCKF